MINNLYLLHILIITFKYKYYIDMSNILKFEIKFILLLFHKLLNNFYLIKTYNN